MHAERCPVCLGTGRSVENNDPKEAGCMACHGCNGKGWVEVSDNNTYYPYVPYRYPDYPPPLWPPYTITYGYKENTK